MPIVIFQTICYVQRNQYAEQRKLNRLAPNESNHHPDGQQLMLHTTTKLLPGIYPEIKKLKPKIGGNNNLGVGVDLDGNEYVLKTGPGVCVAEFVGAALCAAVAVPHCRPTIVCMTDILGQRQHLFGSAIEPEVLRFDMRNIEAWQAVVAELRDTAMFTVMLALDLCIGNDDRHSENWIIRAKDPAGGRPSHQLMAMDFSNAWPTVHPPHPPRMHPSPNTWNFAKLWPSIGIPFDENGFRAACAKIAMLDSLWLKEVLGPMIDVWLTVAECDKLCDWWRDHWRNQVTNVIYALEPDGEWL